MSFYGDFFYYIPILLFLFGITFGPLIYYGYTHQNYVYELHLQDGSIIICPYPSTNLNGNSGVFTCNGTHYAQGNWLTYEFYEVKPDE